MSDHDRLTAQTGRLAALLKQRQRAPAAPPPQAEAPPPPAAPQVQPAPQPAPAPVDETADYLASLGLDQSAPAPATESDPLDDLIRMFGDDPEPEPVARAPEPEPEPEPIAVAPEPEPEPEPAPAPPPEAAAPSADAGGGLAGLAAGLRRRRPPVQPPAEEPVAESPAPEPAPAPEPVMQDAYDDIPVDEPLAAAADDFSLDPSMLDDLEPVGEPHDTKADEAVAAGTDAAPEPDLDDDLDFTAPGPEAESAPPPVADAAPEEPDEPAGDDGTMAVSIDVERAGLIRHVAAEMGCSPDDVIVTALDWYLDALFNNGEEEGEGAEDAA